MFSLRRAVWLAVVSLLLIGTAGPAGAQGPDDWAAPYYPALLPDFVSDLAVHADAPRYDIRLTLALADDTVSICGHQTVFYTNRAGVPLSVIVFRLYPNLDSYGGDMQVGGVTVDGEAIEPGLDETRTILTVPLAAPLDPGARITLDMDFTIALPANQVKLYAQFSYLDGVLALPNAYPVVSVYQSGDGWWQITDHPQGDAVFSETAFYTVSVTAPAHLILAASGSKVDLGTNPDGTLTHQYVAPLMRDFALFASERYVTLSGEQDGVTVTVYYDPDLPEARANAQAGLQITQDAVRIFNAAFGRYPFRELDMVQTPNKASGIEYPGVFVIADHRWNRHDTAFEWVTVHEAAHQWWYSLVGNDQTLHPWIDEALAQYSVAVYIREQEGAEAYQRALAFFRDSYAGRIESGEDRVIGQPVTAYPGLDYFYFVYQKGPLFFGALAEAYGYDVMLDMLHGYFTAYRYGIVGGPLDMLDSFEATSGRDLDDIFQEWIGGLPVG